MEGLKITYPPELVDAAITEHVKKHMGVTGDVTIDYTHRRKTRRVSADVYVSTTPNLAQDAPKVVEEAPKLETPSQASADPEKEPLEVTFEDLPEHEQQEAMGEVEDENESMFDDLPDQEPEENTGSNDEDVEDLFG